MSVATGKQGGLNDLCFTAALLYDVSCDKITPRHKKKREKWATQSHYIVLDQHLRKTCSLKITKLLSFLLNCTSLLQLLQTGMGPKRNLRITTSLYKLDTLLSPSRHLFNGPLSGTTWVSRYQKGKTNLDFTEARDSEWQWHQLGHMQACIALQTDSHDYPPDTHHSVFTDRMPFLPPNQQRQSTEGSDKVLKVYQKYHSQQLSINSANTQKPIGTVSPPSSITQA